MVDTPMREWIKVETRQQAWYNDLKGNQSNAVISSISFKEYIERLSLLLKIPIRMEGRQIPHLNGCLVPKERVELFCSKQRLSIYF